MQGQLRPKKLAGSSAQLDRLDLRASATGLPKIEDQLGSWVPVLRMCLLKETVLLLRHVQANMGIITCFDTMSIKEAVVVMLATAQCLTCPINKQPGKKGHNSQSIEITSILRRARESNSRRVDTISNRRARLEHIHPMTCVRPSASVATSNLLHSTAYFFIQQKELWLGEAWETMGSLL